MSLPKISCLLALHEWNSHCPKAIESILNQSLENFELIILVNGKWDLYEKVRSSFNDPRIIINYSPIPQLSFNLNKGLELAKSDFIARMDSDDISEPTRFEIQLSILEKDKSIKVVSSLCSYIDEADFEIGENNFHLNREKIVESFYFRNPIIHPSVLYRKEAILQVGGYGEYLNEDYSLWIRLAAKFHNPFFIVPQSLIKYRIHGTQSRKRIESYAASAGILFREFVATKKMQWLLGSISFFIRAITRGRKV